MDNTPSKHPRNFHNKADTSPPEEDVPLPDFLSRRQAVQPIAKNIKAKPKPKPKKPKIMTSLPMNLTQAIVSPQTPPPPPIPDQHLQSLDMQSLFND